MTNSNTGQFKNGKRQLNNNSDRIKSWNDNTRRLNIIRFCFCVCQIFNVIGYISQGIKMEGIFSLISRSYIILIAVPFILYFIDSKRLSREVFFLIFMGLSTILAYLLHGEGVSRYSFLLIFFAYLALPMCFLALNDIPFDETIHKVVKLSAIVSALFFAYRFFTDPQYSLNDDLTLGYFNANYLSILLIQNMSLLMVLKSLEHGRWKRSFLWILFLFEGYMVSLTHSRAAMSSAIILLIFSFKREKTISKSLTDLALLLPVVFVLFLTYFGSHGYLNGIEILGKPLLSGRERMFQNAVTFILVRNPIFGYFSDYQLGNAHNAFLSVQTSVGAFGFIFFFGFYYRSIHKLRGKLNGNTTRYLAYIGILLLFLEGCAESPVLTGGSMFAAAAAPLLILLNYNEPEESPLKGGKRK